MTDIRPDVGRSEIDPKQLEFDNYLGSFFANDQAPYDRRPAEDGCKYVVEDASGGSVTSWTTKNGGRLIITEPGEPALFDELLTRVVHKPGGAKMHTLLFRSVEDGVITSIEIHDQTSYRLSLTEILGSEGDDINSLE